MEKRIKQQGNIRLDNGQTLPFLGTVNNFTPEEWNRLCEQQAVRNYTEIYGHEPESVEQALEDQKRRIRELERKHPSAKQQQQIPVKYGKPEITYFQ